MDSRNFQGYELQRLVSKLRIRGFNFDADKLEKDRSINFLSKQASQVVREEVRYAADNR